MNKSITELKNTHKGEDIWIIGGAEIYKQFLDLNLFDKIYLTKINNNYNCDSFFPKLKYESINSSSNERSPLYNPKEITKKQYFNI